MEQIRAYNQHEITTSATIIAGYYDYKNIYRNNNGKVEWCGSYEIREREIIFLGPNDKKVGSIEKSNQCIETCDGEAIAYYEDGQVYCVNYASLDERIRSFCPRCMLSGNNIAVGEADGLVGAGALILLMGDMLFLTDQEFRYWLCGAEPRGDKVRSVNGNPLPRPIGGWAEVLTLLISLFVVVFFFRFIYLAIASPSALADEMIKVAGIINIIIIAGAIIMSILQIIESWNTPKQAWNYIVAALFGVLGAFTMAYVVIFFDCVITLFNRNANWDPFEIPLLITGFIYGFTTCLYRSDSYKKK